MPKRTRPYRARLLESLTKPEEAASYLNAAIEDSPEMFLKAVKDVAQAHQMANVAKQAGVTRESLYRSFSEQGNPTLETLRSVLSVFRLKMEIAPEGSSTRTGPTRYVSNTSRRYGFKGGRTSSEKQLSIAGQLAFDFTNAQYQSAVAVTVVTELSNKVPQSVFDTTVTNLYQAGAVHVHGQLPISSSEQTSKIPAFLLAGSSQGSRLIDKLTPQ